jgi:sterol desaturase/sphingolipid hydroxylase (fatty acid hydroxylase superfamily)
MDSGVIMDLWAFVGAVVARLFGPFFDVIDSRNIFSYLGVLVFVGLFVCALRVVRPRPYFHFGVLRRFLLKRSVWLHPSARLDYKLYAINMLFLAFAFGFVVVGSSFWAGLAAPALAAAFGPPPAMTGTNLVVIAAIIAIQLLAMDFGYWLGHLAMHKVPVLWEFHKVHHSAAVLTPATEFRQHPFEFVVVPGIMSLTMGLGFAVTTQWLGTGAPGLGQFGFNLIMLVHLFSFHHLRHSHFNMPFTGIWGWLIHSPGHHRIHHSNNPLHFDRNLGFLLSIWDAMAGTLYRPRPNEPVVLGIGPEGALHDSVTAAMWLPIRNSWQILSRRRPRRSRLPIEGGQEA